MSNSLLNIHKGEEPLTWDKICQDHVYLAITKVEKRMRKELKKEEFFVFPSGSFLNLRLMAEIAGVEVTAETIPELMKDIDIIMLTDSIPDGSEGMKVFFKLAEKKLDPAVSKFLEKNTGLERCWVYNLQLYPAEFANPEVYIPHSEVIEPEDNIDNAIVIVAGIKRVLEGINMASLFGRGDFYSRLIETLEIAFSSDKFKRRDTPEFREFLTQNLNDDTIIDYQGNILIYIAEKLYKPGFPPIKLKHIKRALKLKFGRYPDDAEVEWVIDDLSAKGYRVQVED